MTDGSLGKSPANNKNPSILIKHRLSASQSWIQFCKVKTDQCHLLIHPEALPAVVTPAQRLSEEAPPEHRVPGLPHQLVVHLQPLGPEVPPHCGHLLKTIR